MYEYTQLKLLCVYMYPPSHMYPPPHTTRHAYTFKAYVHIYVWMYDMYTYTSCVHAAETAGGASIQAIRIHVSSSPVSSSSHYKACVYIQAMRIHLRMNARYVYIYIM